MPPRVFQPKTNQSVKSRLLIRRTPYKLLALVQLNTGFRLSEPLFARREDLVLDHEIPHLWIRKNSLSDRKTKSSIRAVPLVGVSLQAARELHDLSVLGKQRVRGNAVSHFRLSIPRLLHMKYKRVMFFMVTIFNSKVKRSCPFS